MKLRAIITFSLFVMLLITSLNSSQNLVVAQNDETLKSIGFGGTISKTSFNSQDEVTYSGSVMYRGTSETVVARAFVVFFEEVLPEKAIREPRNKTIYQEIDEKLGLLKQNETLSYTLTTKVDLAPAEYYVSIYFEIAPKTQVSTIHPNIVYSLVNETVVITNVPTSTRVLLYVLGGLGLAVIGIIVYVVFSSKK